MKLTDNEIVLLKEILKHVTHEYHRGFQCKCGHVCEKEFTLHNAETNNHFGNMVCKNCGETRQWHDIKIKKIKVNFNRVKNFEIIESCDE